jgi:hypothetical protein
MSRRAILHIPDSKMLENYPVSYWVAKFADLSRHPPTEISLPAVDYRGLNYESRIGLPSQALGRENTLPDWTRHFRELIGGDSIVWASVLTSLPFFSVESIMAMDQYGRTMDNNMCISNKVVKTIFSVLMEEISSLGLSGVSFDITDLYPNTTSAGLAGIQNTCFCEYCLGRLERAGWEGTATHFMGDGNISRLVLKETETGAAHIDPRHEIISNRDVQTLIEIAKAREFVAKEEDVVGDAELLLTYLACRAKATAVAMREIGNVAKEYGMRTAIIMGSQDYDLSQASDLAAMVEENTVDEYWIPSVREEYAVESGASLIQFLGERSTYFYNYFFESVHRWLGERDALVARAARTVVNSTALDPENVFVSNISEAYVGFAGVPLGTTEVARFSSPELNQQ